MRSVVKKGNRARPKKCKKEVLWRGLDPPRVELSERYRLIRTMEGLLKLAWQRQAAGSRVSIPSGVPVGPSYW